MSKHTPGPWTIKPVTADKVYPHGVVGDDLCRLAKVVCEGDARLIAAAPELLAALERMVRASVNQPEDTPEAHTARREARAVIARAKGE